MIDNLKLESMRKKMKYVDGKLVQEQIEEFGHDGKQKSFTKKDH